nr:reverse transcriptase domain-containing protein [Tanacetum cinerariifolium]
MSTRSSARNIFPPLDNPELIIRRRSRTDPTLLDNSKMVDEGNGDLPVRDLQTIEKLCQPSLNGRGGPIAPIDIQAMNFGLKNDMIQQVQNSCQFHGLPGDDANKHLDKFLHVTQNIKVNGVTDDALRLYLFPHSLTHHATTWFDRLPRNSINTFEHMAKMFLGGTFMKRRLEECYDLIENMTAHHNDWDTSAQRSELSSSITSSFDTEIAALKAEMPPLATLRTYMLQEPIKNKLSLPDLSPICMTLELVDRSISHLVGVAEDVFVKVGTIHFLTDFVVVDFDADPRVPLILRRYFLKTEIAMIDVFEGELTLRVGKEAMTFNLDQTSRYSANYNDMTANRIDVIDMVCEEYSQEVLDFSDVIASGNLTPYYDPIVSTTSLTLTPFENSDFLLEEVDAFLALEDDPTSLEVDQYYELKICEAKSDKSSIDEPFEVELKDLPPHLEYVFLEGDDKLPVIIAKDLSVKEKTALITVLKSHKRAIAWKLSDIKGIDPEFCTHKILMEEDVEPAIQHQRIVNPKSTMSSTMSFSGYFQIPIDPKVQEKTTFTCSYGTFAYRRMPFGLCNAPSTFQRCMMAIFHDMIEKTMEVFMDDFSIFRNSFQACLSYLEKMLKRCEDTNLCLNWEKSHFMVKEGIVLGHKISKEGIEVEKAKVDVITKLSHPTTVKGIRCFLGHADFYRRFIQDFSNIARSMTRLLEKDTSFLFSKECVKAFQTLKIKLTEAPILIAPEWDIPFELMCDASDFAIGAVLGQRQEKHFRPIHYASKTMIEAESNYITTEKEMLAVVFAFEKFRSYLIMTKSIVYTDHSALKYLFAKKDSQARQTLLGSTPPRIHI